LIKSYGTTPLSWKPIYIVCRLVILESGKDVVNSEKPVEPFTTMDSKPLSRAHLKIWFTAGMGFFTDAYDLFIIGVALLIFGAYNIPGFTLHSTIFGQAVAGFIGSSAIFATMT
jgi:hypothetical protein